MEYSFAPGESYWRDRRYAAVNPACAAGHKTAACQSFLGKNDKARLEADLEERFAEFERTYGVSAATVRARAERLGSLHQRVEPAAETTTGYLLRREAARPQQGSVHQLAALIIGDEADP